MGDDTPQEGSGGRLPKYAVQALWLERHIPETGSKRLTSLVGENLTRASSS
jgi:hypothetical protein